jgi:hypothetical protein
MARDGRAISVSLDFRILLLVGVTTSIALLLFGVLPALHGARISNVAWGRTGAGGLGQALGNKWNAGRFRVTAQMGMSVVLVMAAVIFTRNLMRFQSADPGFDRRNLVMFGVRPGTSGYGKTRLEGFYFNLKQQLAATPGVEAVGLSSMRPMNVGGRSESVRLPGQSAVNDVSVNGVTPEYLPLYISRMVTGRNITQADIDSGAKVAVVSEDLARQLGKRSLVGRLLEFTGGPPEPNRRSTRLWALRP